MVRHCLTHDWTVRICSIAESPFGPWIVNAGSHLLFVPPTHLVLAFTLVAAQQFQNNGFSPKTLFLLVGFNGSGYSRGLVPRFNARWTECIHMNALSSNNAQPSVAFASPRPLDNILLFP
jgi:hypothetical protein